jgi:organic hydroperoxide reductase OsmC/OhrA
MDEKQLTVEMELVKGFEFRVRFDEGMIDLLMDEPPPLSNNRGPNASRILSAAIGNCLSASLVFCLQKARITPRAMKTTVTTSIVRNEKGRFRIGRSDVDIVLDTDATEGPNRMAQCLKLFEDFCVVTQSVRKGIPVSVEVKTPTGEQILRSDGSV